ncbi:hypothetical protein MUN78_07125 [Leucobacter allii]|uniref:Uncharacterized protein n=1 Tax=Leucobacter allii TaxID=2932247 RepID=A0ABY4FQX8_9MICO|nr:hypothetical protein [Leucobacter allii]UOQ58589.1 hypothetical protein MUN78_07125 [Leucobacter allii]
MSDQDIVVATFAVEVRRVELVTDEIVRGFIKLASGPRPGRRYAVRDLPSDYAVEIAYIGYPDAPRHVVGYQDIVRAWAALASEGLVDRDPASCSIADSIRVIDRACDHIPPHTSRRTS